MPEPLQCPKCGMYVQGVGPFICPDCGTHFTESRLTEDSHCNKCGASSEDVELVNGLCSKCRPTEFKMDKLSKKLNEYLDKRLDFTQYAATVALWPDAQLYAALEDIKKTLPNADAVDRERAGSGAASEGGYYRDQAGVIRAEIARRQRNALRGQ